VKRTVSGAPFAFIEFSDERDAQEAIKGRDGYNFNGYRLRVEIPFAARGGPPRGRGGPGGGGGGGRGRGGAPRRGEHRVIVNGLPPSGSWQDLKDHMRDAGECVYADVFRDGTGVVEFSRREDVDYALKFFDGSKFRSHEGEVSRLSLRRSDDGGSRRSPSPYYSNRYDGRGRADSRDGGRYDGRHDSYDDRHDDHRRPPSGHYEDRGRRRSPSPYGRSPSRSRSRSRSRR